MMMLGRTRDKYRCWENRESECNKCLMIFSSETNVVLQQWLDFSRFVLSILHVIDYSNVSFQLSKSLKLS